MHLEARPEHSPATPVAPVPTAGALAAPGSGPAPDAAQVVVGGAADLLRSGVPLSLLLDLALPLDSRALLTAEGGSAAWLRSTA